MTSDPANDDLLHPPLPTTAGKSRPWSGLHGCAASLAVVSALKRSTAPLLLIAATPRAAEQYLEELRFFLGPGSDYALLLFPDRETLPYDRFSPAADIVSDRMEILARLPELHRGIVIVSIVTLMHRLVPREYVAAYSLLLERGQRLEWKAFRHRLTDCGYRWVGQVMERGEASRRGSLIDLFPMGAERPCRLDLLDDRLDSLRSFDPETQRSTGEMQSLHVLPGSETPLDTAHVARFRDAWREAFPGNPLQVQIYREVSAGRKPDGIEYYLPLFHAATCSLLDYLPADSIFLTEEGVWDAAARFERDIKERYARGREQAEAPPLPPERLFEDSEQLRARLDEGRHVEYRSAACEDGKAGAARFGTRPPVPVPIDARAQQPLARLNRFLEEFGGRVLLVADTPGTCDTLLEMLGRDGLRPRRYGGWQDFCKAADTPSLGIAVAPLERGLHLERPRLAICTEAQLFGRRVRQERLRRRQRSPEEIVRGVSELVVGAPIVHEEHGVGRYRGLTPLETDGILGEFLCLEYAQGDKLYVPVTSLERIARYTGVDPEHAPLHRLGSGQWERACARVARNLRDVAAELLELHARRAARHGHAFHVDERSYQAFCQTFPYEETPGQQETIAEVLADMRSSQPMDRLVCGDSGFGKTEVALRAAFVCADNHRQTAMLAPTTVLARQHYRNFRDRYADWPIRVALLSRFSGTGKDRETLSGLEDGTIDIVIGTHKLLQERVRFKRLGLMIVDEEHRFGVGQKECLKEKRAEVDILTLTATPIPRTLSLSLSQLRRISVISTPPARRLPVRTFVLQWDETMLREAMLREVQRGGQVYFVHNRIESIEQAAQRVRGLLPDTELRIAHGRLREREMERVMNDFYHQRFQVLVCTTIIENGIDVPSANTIIVDRADRYGLAQLYQLRGRVGRSHHNAYAYLLIPPRSALREDALRRLEAVTALDTLGIGFTLAMHDLEIRGAGNVLGKEQSGHIQEIGYGAYVDLLRRAVTDLRTGQLPERRQERDTTEIDLQLPALFPQDYIPDPHTRLTLYKRLSEAGGEWTPLREELIDRFGPLPEPATNLFRIAELRYKAGRLGIRRVDLGRRGGSLHFRQNTPLPPGRLARLAQDDPGSYRLATGDRLRIATELPEPRQRLEFLAKLLDGLLAHAKAA